MEVKQNIKISKPVKMQKDVYKSQSKEQEKTEICEHLENLPLNKLIKILM